MDTHNTSPAIWRGDLEDKLGYERPEWRKRIVALSSFIDGEDESVMDLGAGSMYLQRLLGPETKYYPVDYKKNCDNTIVCDFNKGEFPDIDVDVICAAGILDYITKPEWFLSEICKHCRKVLISYKGREKYDNAPLFSKDIIAFFNDLGFGLTGRIDELEEWTLLACFERITPYNMSKQLLCTGCGCCNNICPKSALCIDYDDEGYLKPILDRKMCIQCGKCISACPALHRPVNKSAFTTPECYAVWANDEVRLQSSSGGFFTILSQYVLDKGGVVFGAKWEDGFFCGIHRANSYNDILPMRFSKYTQSNTHYSFSEVYELLISGVWVAYFGCPCQISGLNSYLKNKSDRHDYLSRLITVDLVCFCAPSNVYFRKYLDENFGINNVANVQFRDKTKLGWSPVGYKVVLRTGKVLYPDISDDCYQKAFHGVIARNDTCEKCTYYEFPRQGNFSIGDFWGIDKHVPRWNDGKGTSLVLINDEKAKRVLEEIRESIERLEEVPLSFSMQKGNRVDNSVRIGHPNRKYFYDMLRDGKSFNDAVNDALTGKHDIGLVCLTNFNIGNNLTNYALYQVLSDMGYRTLLISNPENDYGENSDYRFSRFLRLPYKKYDIYSISKNRMDLYQFNNLCDLFLVGSDQLFRAEFVDMLDYFSLLDWVKGYKYKLSYGTSFGVSKFEGDGFMKNKMSHLFKRFQKISVRENCSVGIMKDIFGCDAERVLDPVFLCDKKYYNEMASIGKLRTPQKGYVGAYILDVTDNKKSVLRRVADQITAGEYQAITDYPQNCCDEDISILNEPAIEEWLAMIDGAEFFVTDSFHGICFALIFKKQFIVVFDKDNWRGYERIIDILSMFGLEDRIITEDKDTAELSKIIADRIDYSVIDKILESEIRRSYEWLMTAIGESKSYRGSYDNNDMLAEFDYTRMKQLEDTICILDKELKKLKSCHFLSLVGMKKTVEEKIGLNGGNMIVVGFGAGECLRRNKSKIKEFYDLKYVCDNDPDKWGKDLGDGITCISPGQLAQMRDVLVVIMVDNVRVSFEIVDELRNMGISEFTHIENWLTSVY